MKKVKFGKWVPLGLDLATDDLGWRKDSEKKDGKRTGSC